MGLRSTSPYCIDGKSIVWGLMPENPAERKALELLNPYELRDKGLSEKLPLSHLERAIWLCLTTPV